jgi:four helix bundle protein
MEPKEKKYGSFQDLDVYKAEREFRKNIYKVAKQLPESEKYNLNVQMRRAALSLTNNIAEGHGRFHYLDNIRFVLISRGSLAELFDDLNACEDEGYLPAAQIVALKADATNLLRQINGYIRYLRDRKVGASLALREEPGRYSAGNDSQSLEEFEDEAPIANHQSPITNHQSP